MHMYIYVCSYICTYVHTYMHTHAHYFVRTYICFAFINMQTNYIATYMYFQFLTPQLDVLEHMNLNWLISKKFNSNMYYIIISRVQGDKVKISKRGIGI